MHSKNTGQTIVFIDGDCSFCNRSAQVLLEMDDDERLLFATLQGETAKEVLPAEYRTEESISTMAARLPDGTLRYRTDAVIAILIQIGGPYSLAILGKLIPRRIRDGLYAVVARYRRRLIRKSFCMMPDPGDRNRFLP